MVMLITQYSLQQATWRVPVDSLEVAEGGAWAGHSQLHTLMQNANPAKSMIEPKPMADSGVKKEVALKVISKKKVKGNEASVWGEMEVLHGLNHPNIASVHLLRLHPGALTLP